MIINVKVFPRAGREEIVKISEDSFKVYLKKPAVDNKANIELLKLLKKHFKSSVRLISGERSRDKVIDVSCD